MDIFVFGSNLGGRHGKGSALEALRNHGAVYGRGVGLQGQSYAIPTKDNRLRILSLSDIRWHVANFVTFAESHPEMTFNVVRVGCGLAGYEEEIAPLFAQAPKNCLLPDGWRELGSKA